MDEERIETMISNLPPEILRQIVSLVPLKDAVRTSTLSTSWKSLWTPFEVEFDFDPDQITSDGDKDDDEANEKLNQIMGFLSKSSSSPELWRFSLQMGKTEKPLFFSAAKGGGGKELNLDFLTKGNEIPCDFNLVFNPIARNSNFSSVKTLHLVSANSMAKDLVSDLFSNCHVLENLKLEKCRGIQRIDIKASDSLKNFEVLGCRNLESIAISAPNLKSFWYRGALPLIQIKNCLNLVDVVLDLGDGFGCSEFECEDVLNLFSSMKDIENLKISGWLLEWLCAAGVVFGRLQFKFNRLKELWWFDSVMNQTKRDSLACFLHITPLLEKLFVKIDQNLSSITCPFFHQHWHEPHLWMDFETVKSNASQLEHLKTIQLEGFRDEDEDQLMMLLDLLLRMGVTLKSMILTSPGKNSRRVTKIPKILVAWSFEVFFVPGKRSGSKSGFVRYDCHVSAGVAISKAHGLWIDDKKLFVKIASFGQDVNRQNGKQRNHHGYITDSSSISVTRTATATLLKMVSLLKITGDLRKNNYDNVQVRHMGGRFVLLTCANKDIRDKLIQEKWLQKWFGEVKQWNGEAASLERFALIDADKDYINGLPLDIWSLKTFKSNGEL
ncbi:hypothetical protein Vadar_032408 [Vaccinium darrowii]|uniref:Uncharacterized protein n=1 Tax=Vaccinium darrowii TaxID=229202 RepID=A0ACB7XUX2_9ERIC|nr:hypothetical protein Vadar_032408 [Vaccinium darrowii]